MVVRDSEESSLNFWKELTDHAAKGLTDISFAFNFHPPYTLNLFEKG